MSGLHFARPDLLWALALTPLLAWLWRSRGGGAAWRAHVDAPLLHALLLPAPRARRVVAPALVALAWALAVLALAGPGWRRNEAPLATARTPLAMAVDLSSAALAADVPPTRLAQARAKLARVLAARNGAPVALVAYADDAYTVAPLTDDAANVALYLDALAPDVMPVDGQRAARAIDWSAALLRRAGNTRGDILLLAGSAEPEARAAARRAHDAGFDVHVLGVGADAPTAYRTRAGGIAQSVFDEPALRALARAGGGRYARLRPDGDADLRALGVLDAATGGRARQHAAAGWRDEGAVLLPLLMLLVLPAFRRGAGASLVLLVALHWPGPARATDWWRRPDQQQAQAMHEAAQAYRRGAFADAARRYATVPGADAAYNRGNALARQGDYAAAVAAYDQALRQQPGMADAVANRRAVMAAMKRQPPGRKGGPQGNKGGAKAGAPTPSAKGTPGQATDTSGTPGRAASPSPKPGDARAQQRADEAQRARMREALQRRRAHAATARPAPRETAAQRERRLANDAWLQRVPDDPGSLLRAKFRLEYQRRQGARLQEP